MSFINHSSKEIFCKILYFGPSLSGKTTNLQWIYQETQQHNKSELFSLPTDTERTLFFDFIPFQVGKINGFDLRFHLYTVPGQVVYEPSRRLILKGADGLIFVADSQRERLSENQNSLQSLKTNIEKQEKSLEKMPFAFQYNKRDLSNALPLTELRAELNTWGAPDFEARAHIGEGVFDTLGCIMKKIIASLKSGRL